MIELDGHKLTIEDLINISRNFKKINIQASSLKKINKCRNFVDDLSKQKRSIYGINTGFGPLSRTRITNKDYYKHQMNLLHHLSVGQGDLFSDDETRAIMVARANALTRGYSGIRASSINKLLLFLNEEIYPEIPTLGSVGASGDLIPLAHMTRSLTGLGYVKYKNKRIKAKTLLKKMNIKPLKLEAKEGLAFVNGTSVMTGIAALNTNDAKSILSLSELLSSFFVEVMYGEPEPFCNRVAFARGHRGQSVVSSRIAEYLKSNKNYRNIIDNHKWGTYSKPIEKGIDIQDPYSIRCLPQILGAIQDSLWHVEKIVKQELNATTDNPLIFPDEKMVIHCGNFYGQHISFVMDYLKLGIAKIALLTERQIERLLNEKYNLGMSFMLTKNNLGLNSGFMGCQLLATSIAAEIRLLCNPASIQTIPTNANNQDVVSMGTHSARFTSKIINLIWKMLSIYSLVLAGAFEIRNDPKTRGKLYTKFYNSIRKISKPLNEDRPLYEDIEKVSKLLQNPQFMNKFCNTRPGK